MIVVVGRVQTDAENRDELIRVGQAVAQASRAEDGCLAYRVYEDTEQPHAFVFVEEWESQAALDRHFATDHVAKFMRAINSVIAGPPDVRFHSVARSVDLADVQAG